MSKQGVFLLFALLAAAGCATAPKPEEHAVTIGGLHGGEPEAPVVPVPPSTPPPLPAASSNATASRTNSFFEEWISLDDWSRENGAFPIQRIASSPTPEFALTSSNGVLVVRAGSLVANWRGLEFYLGFAPRMVGTGLYMHELDLRKNVEPLLRPAAQPVLERRVIVIDPGHGGQNRGASNVVDGLDEKVFTLDWARRLAPLLAAEGWQVFLTRSNDADVPLAGRVAIADERKADLFVSLHFNAPGVSQSGIETYCLTPVGMHSTLTRDYADDITHTYANNSFDEQNIAYAFRLHEAILRVTGAADHGIRRARFMTVLREQARPAVLIEGGYLSNPREARRIAEPAYREKLAEAVAQALARPAGMAAPQVGPGLKVNFGDEGARSSNISTNGEN
jgi:N-acetylmuramoyl-L-alanine amidase